jgi:hypothetical protein
MKRITILLNLLIISQLSNAQTILAGSELFEKARKDGLYFTINIDKKFIEKEWQNYISKFGKVSKSKETYEIGAAKMSDVSPDPVNFQTKLTGDKTKTTIFCAFDTGGGNMVTNNTNNYSAAEKILKDFYQAAMHNESVRLAEKDVEASESNLERVVKTGDRLAKDIERNKKEKENLLKKIEENKLDLEKLVTDQTTNKQDQENAKIAVEEKKKALEQVKKN